MRHVLAAGLSLWLAACALQPAQLPPPVAWVQREPQLQTLKRFVVNGRLSSNQAGVAGAALHWSQNGDAFDIRLSGPFGAGAISITGTPDDVLLRSGDESLRTHEPEAWLRERLGWSLPVRGLRHWLVGLPAPAAEAHRIWDERQRLATLTQLGWTLNYEQYQLSPFGELPRLIVLERGDLRVKLLIDEWLEPSAASSS